MDTIEKPKKNNFLRFKIELLREIFNRKIKQGIVKKIKAEADSFYYCVLCGYYHKRG
jgi:hypothetical protein